MTFESLKKVLTETVESRREAEFEKRQQICEKFQNTPFQQLVASSQSKVYLLFHSSLNDKKIVCIYDVFLHLKGDVLNDTLNQILTRISTMPSKQEVTAAAKQPDQPMPIYGNNFPDLFVY